MSNMLQNMQNQGQPQQSGPNINELYQQFRQNPVEFLAKSNLGIPQGMTDPMQILQFMNSNGRIPPQLQGQVNQFLIKQR